MKSTLSFLILYLFVLFPLTINAQIDYSAEVSQMVRIPNSPEAQAFATYGNTDVNLHAGVPNIAVPLYTHQGLEMDLPVSLTYDASGIKVEQMATWVGLGWNLNVGGRISRIVNGLPDDFITGGGYWSLYRSEVKNSLITYNQNNHVGESGLFFTSVTDADSYFNFLKDISENDIDAQPDFFSLNVPGLNETLVIDYTDNYIPKALNNPRLKIEKTNTGIGNHVNSWKVTAENGVVYHFQGVYETTKSYNFNDGSSPNQEYATSWLLTRIESPNKKDIYDFQYNLSLSYWNSDTLGSSALQTVTNIITTQSSYSTPNEQYAGLNNYNTTQPFLTQVFHNGSVIVQTELGTRSDLDATGNYRLNKLLIKSGTDTIKAIDFDNDHYFNSDEVNPNHTDIRLKLDGLKMLGSDQLEYEAYTFTYDRPDELPNRTSKAQDKFGYYNGKNGNSVIYPSYSFGTYTFSGADRSLDGDKAKIGLLKRITYPTGGYTDFEYEPHDLYKSTQYNYTEYLLGMNLSGSSITNPNLYRDDNNVICDDAFLPDEPKIEIKQFVIPEQGDYRVELSGTSGEIEAIILQINSTVPPENCPICSDDPFNDNYCEFINKPNHWSSVVAKDELVLFGSGTYEAMLLLDESSANTYGSATLNVTRDSTVTNFSNLPVGGIRIKSVKNYTDQNAFASGKNYVYRNGTKSSGRINYDHGLVKFSDYWQDQNTQKEQLIRTAALPGSSAPYIVYDKVREFSVDENGQSLGNTEYRFFTNYNGVVPSSSPPYTNTYYANLRGGQAETVDVFKASGDTLRNTSYTYETIPDFVIRGRMVYQEPNYLDQFVFLKPHTLSDGTQGYLSERLQNYDCSSNPCVVPGYFTSPTSHGYTKYYGADISALGSRLTYAASGYGGVSVVKTTDYQEGENSSVVKVTSEESTTYDATVDYLPRDMIKTDAQGDVYKTTYSYPKDVPGAISDSLLAYNRLNEVLELETFKNNQLLSTRFNDMVQVGEAFVPSVIKTRKGAVSNTTEGRLHFSYYGFPDKPNLKESYLVDGPHTVYIWGYQDRLPVAKIENATYTDIPQSIIDDIKTKSNIENNGVLGDYNAENELRTSLNALRTQLPNALVTTYTYDPAIGVTSITDPTGNTVYYTYDAFNRLKEIRDQNDNLVSDYEYHYKNQN